MKSFLLGAYYVLGSKCSTQFISFISRNNTMMSILLLAPFYRWGNRGSEMLSKVPKGTPLVRARTKTCTQGNLSLSPRTKSPVPPGSPGYPAVPEHASAKARITLQCRVWFICLAFLLDWKLLKCKDWVFFTFASPVPSIKLVAELGTNWYLLG